MYTVPPDGASLLKVCLQAGEKCITVGLKLCLKQKENSDCHDIERRMQQLHMKRKVAAVVVDV